MIFCEKTKNVGFRSDTLFVNQCDGFSLTGEKNIVKMYFDILLISLASSFLQTLIVISVFKYLVTACIVADPDPYFSNWSDVPVSEKYVQY